MLFISHDLAVVSQVADRVMVMRHGRSLESGPAREVFRQPLHPYTTSLLGAVPTMATDRSAPLATLPAEAEAARGPMVELAPGRWVRQPESAARAGAPPDLPGLDAIL